MQALAIAAYLFVSELGEFYALAVIFGMAYGGVMPLYAVLAREYFGQRIMGTVFGAATMLSSLGMAFGPLAGGWVFDTFATYCLAVHRLGGRRAGRGRHRAGFPAAAAPAAAAGTGMTWRSKHCNSSVDRAFRVQGCNRSGGDLPELRKNFALPKLKFTLQKEKPHDLYRRICRRGAERQPREVQEARRRGREGFEEYGALKVVECWGVDVPDGQVTSFPMAVQRKDDENVVFSWIVWPSKEARKTALEKVMADPRMQPERNPMPFDGKRMIFGGFEPIVER